MSESVIPAGTYNLLEFKLYPSTTDSNDSGAQFVQVPKTIDIKGIVHTWNIVESMTKGHLSGSAKVYDSEGVYYTHPIRGQERLKISYKDYEGVERTEEMFVYFISDIRTPKKTDDSVLEYTIHFVSWGKFWSERFSVARCIAEGSNSGRKYIPVSEQVQILFDDYYDSNGGGTNKEIRIHATEGDQQIVIPNMRPEAAMHLMSRRAYSVNYPSSYYRFYESRDQYNFVNMEELNAGEVKKKFTYVSGPQDTTPDAEVQKMVRIIDMSFQSPVDTLDAMKKGAYYRKLEEVDITNRRVNAYEYEHNDEFITYIYPGQNADINLRHTEQFINQHLNDWTSSYVIKDYPDEDQPNAFGLRTKTNYGQIKNNKPAHAYDYRMTRMDIKVYGDNELFVGDLIELEFPYFSVYAEKDVERSGVYIIESITNLFYEDTYMQQMTVSKGPIGDIS